MIPIIGAAIGLVKTLASSYLERKKIEAQGRIDVAKARVQSEVKRAENEDVYDIKAAEGMRYSWKDEWLCIVFSGVFIACFLPWTQPYVKEGFSFLKENTPRWFEWCFTGIVAASFGLRGWNVWKNGKKLL